MTYEQCVERLKNEFQCEEVYTTKEDFEDIVDYAKKLHGSKYRLTLHAYFKVKLCCGHTIRITIENLRAKKNPFCQECNKRFSYEEVVEKFKALGVELLTSKEQYLAERPTIHDSAFDLRMSCGHVRKARYQDIADLENEKRLCAPCARKAKNNGRLDYEDICARFEKIGCTMVTTKEEYERDHMTITSRYEFACECGATMSGIPANMSMKCVRKCAACKRK